MKIMETVKKIPGGLMIVPLLLGCLVNTFFPQVFAYFDGTFTYSLWKGGSMSLLAAFRFAMAQRSILKKQVLLFIKELY